jgi:hypothetical protein
VATNFLRSENIRDLLDMLEFLPRLPPCHGPRWRTLAGFSRQPPPPLTGDKRGLGGVGWIRVWDYEIISRFAGKFCKKTQQRTYHRLFFNFICRNTRTYARTLENGFCTSTNGYICYLNHPSVPRDSSLFLPLKHFSFQQRF